MEVRRLRVVRVDFQRPCFSGRFAQMHHDPGVECWKELAGDMPFDVAHEVVSERTGLLPAEPIIPAPGLLCCNRFPFWALTIPQTKRRMGR